ncbi:MAG: glycerol-3-phosphate dehydrogenase [Cyclobacteriaceae bacterium]|jgi:glycerol-3-phosphate dehydrogenase
MNCFDARYRAELIKTLDASSYDLIVIGGGVTGAGIVLDAATRGLKAVLIEQNDFASGTSSKSTKLVHGGLRYLKQFEIALVREVGMERAVVHKLAPHLVKPEKMLLPLIEDGTFGKMLTSLGLMVYDVLAGVEKEDQRKMLTKEETLALEPTLREDILEGGGIYAEYRTDDARLTVEILKTAAKLGADVINYAEATGFDYENGQISAINWKDNLTGDNHTIKAHYTVSAAGPWVDEIREKNNSLQGKHLHPTKGVHIVVARDRFPIKQALYFDVPDGRMLFAIPRDRITYIGTTDTDYFGDIDDVRTDLADVEYLVDGVNHIFPEVALKVEDVESTWVGLRPLIQEEGKSASELSRKDEIFESETGLLSIAGGKLTGYRKMAERIIDRIAKREESEGRKIGRGKTENTILCGGVFDSAIDVDSYIENLSERLKPEQLSDMANYLVSNYGRQSEDILKLLAEEKNPDPQVRLGMAELTFTLQMEAVFTLLDFFERRTGRLYFNIGSLVFLRVPVLTHMTAFFGWDSVRVQHETAALNHAIQRASNFN